MSAIKLSIKNPALLDFIHRSQDLLWCVAVPTTVNNKEIPLNTFPFYDFDEPAMLSESDSSDSYK